MNRLVVSAILAGLLQIGFLGWMIGARAAILRSGTEVRLKVEPVDPRDFLRGDYVWLGYEIGTVPSEIVRDASTNAEQTESGPVTRGGTITVRLAPGPDGFWRPVDAFLGTPPAPAGERQADIKGRVSHGWGLAPNSPISVQYGIERYYVPEGEGRPIEARLGQGTFSIKAAVGADGTAQIKSLMEGEEALYDEPLF